MAILKKKEIRAMTLDERQKKIALLRVDLSKELAKRATGGAPTKPSTIRNLKRTIAKLMTPADKKKPTAPLPVKKGGKQI